MEQTRKAMKNEKIDRSLIISETFEDPEKFKRLIVAQWFPLERYHLPFETEQQRIDRRYAEICSWFKQKKQRRKNDKGQTSGSTK